MLYENRESHNRLSRTTEYPVTVTNFDRETIRCADRDELFHALVNTKRQDANIIVRIIAAQCVHPEYFISKESMQLMRLYRQFKRFGMDVLYSADELPSGVLMAFDSIWNVIEEHEVLAYKETKQKLKK